MMRPDEQANASEISRDQSNRQMLRRGIGSISGLAVGGASARIMPFLSEHLPMDLAMKGLSKVAPGVADFLKKGQSAGLDIKQGMEFVKEKLTPREESKQESRNLIEQYSPELHHFISQHIKSGKTHLQAGGLARLERKGEKGFKSIIDKITKEHGASWEDILESVYGGSQNQSQSAQNPMQNTSLQQPAQQKQAPYDGPPVMKGQSGYQGPNMPPHPNSARGIQQQNQPQQNQSDSQAQFAQELKALLNS